MASLRTQCLGEATKAAIAFIIGHIRSHADALKVQTSCGNYLSTLTVCSELVDFDDPDSWEHNKDDLILKAAIYVWRRPTLQPEHYVPRLFHFCSLIHCDCASSTKLTCRDVW